MAGGPLHLLRGRRRVLGAGRDGEDAERLLRRKVDGNVGAALSPLGDPPLFIGFLKGVDFFWTTRALALPTLSNELHLSSVSAGAATSASTVYCAL